MKTQFRMNRLMCPVLLLWAGILLIPSVTDAKEKPVKPVVEFNVIPFDLPDVQLLYGPCKRAMELDAEYLLRLEPDRLLAWFRKEAGLAPKGEVYGGWEKQGVAGHTLGHYLSACSLMYASTHDSQFKERVDYIVDELEVCQNANGNGYVAAIPEGKRIFQEVAAGNIRTQGFDLNGGWVPFYTLHKLFAGLREAYHYCGNHKALVTAKNLADWVETVLSNLNDNQMQDILRCEHGGMNEVMADLYADTGDNRYLALSKRFHHQAVLNPLTNQVDQLNGLHGNTQIPKLIGLARRYELTGEEADRKAAVFFWDRVVHHHSYVIGGHSNNEHFGPPDQLNDRLGANTCETCNTYNMLKLTRHLFSWHVLGEIGDYYERALYNHILASQNPFSGMVCYYIPLQSGLNKTYSKPFDDFWCCVGTGMENHAKYGESIYFHDENSLFVNLFIASELNWKKLGVIVRQETQYPEDDTIHLEFTCKKPVKLSLRIRYPGWAKDGFDVKVNGEKQAIDTQPGYFAEVNRTWNNKDHVLIKIPLSLRLEAMPDNPHRAAILYGPLVLAGELGLVDDPNMKSPDYVPALLTGDKPITDWLKPVEGKTATFRTDHVGMPREITLSPFYRLHDKRYAVYWDFLTPQQWKERETANKIAQERLRKLDAITVDQVQPGDAESERAHHQQGEKTNTGEFNHLKFRHAADGWFAYDVKVLPNKPMSLLCTYWGSDSGKRSFDVLVDGTKVVTQSLQNNKPGEFFDETYTLSEKLTQGKTQVTVQFQAQAGNFAGGIFGLRTIQRENVVAPSPPKVQPPPKVQSSTKVQTHPKVQSHQKKKKK